MSVRKTIKWMLLIVVALAVAAGGYGYWKWTHANALLLEHIRAAIAEKAPGWHVEVEAARFDWHRRVHIYNVTLRDRDGTATILHVPEAVLIVDREKLAETQTVDIQRVRLIKPELHLTRDSQGRWNFQKLPPLKPSPERLPLPEVAVENATAHVRLEQADGTAPAEVQLRQLSVKLVPRAARQFLVEGSTTVRDAGTLSLGGTWHVDAETWSFDGRMQNVQANGELLALAVGTSPELRSHIARLETALRKFTPPPERPKAPVDADALPNLGASAVVDLAFHLAQPSPGTELQFDVRAKVREGRIDNPALPLALHELQADVHWNNDRVEIREVTARSGTLRLSADADVRRAGTATPARIRLSVVELPLNARLQRRLPESWRKIYDTIQPVGSIDVAGILDYDGQTWTPRGFVLRTRDCSFSHAEYPYRFTSVNGTIAQRDAQRVFDFDFTGRAGRQSAKLAGELRDPGPKSASWFKLSVDGLLLDDNLRAGCPEGARTMMKALAISGRVNATLTTTYRAEFDKEPHVWLSADMLNCAIKYDKFPYRLESLKGRATFNSKTGDWKFTNLSAARGEATFTGSGFLVENDGRKEFELGVAVTKARLDRPLYKALPDSLQQVWDDLSPSGQVDLFIRLKWREGRPLDVSIPRCTLTDGTMLASSFPYAFEKISAKFAWDEPRLRILSFTARHDETRVRAEGFAETHPDGEWRLRLVKFIADDLVPDRTFRRALGPDLRSVFEELNPRGPVSITGSVLEFRGTNDKKDPVTAAWDLKTVFAGNALKLGVELTNVHGRVFSRGKWDGRVVQMTHADNRFDLDSIHVHGYQFTKVKGPYWMSGKHLIAGSPEIFKPPRRGERRRVIPLKDRITAEAVGGHFTLDADVNFEKQTDYRVLITVKDARLEKFARRYMRNSRNLQGMVNGRVQLAGKGQSSKNLTGRGRVLISPAALYELPVFVQTFKVLNFVPPDRTAFKLAYLDFSIRNRQLNFNTIDLLGDAINLRGRGAATFDGRIALNFYSMLPRSRLPGAILKQLVATATSGWVGVDVRGTVKNPVARVRAIPQLDDALQGFLRAFGTPPPGVPPPYRPRSTPPPRTRPRRLLPFPF